MHWKRWFRHGSTKTTRSYHGGTGTPEYITWSGTKNRCFNKNDVDYPYYGGRGIKVCERWLGVNGFSNFLEDMGERPTPKHTLDRKDNDGNYEPSNCKWETRLTQANNTRQNHILEFNGRKQTIAQWAREIGVSRDALKYRIYRGWTVERALTTELRKVG